jgi:hypothetical protein
MDVIDDYATRLQDACKRDDEIAAAELVGEIQDADEKVAVWSLLDSAERSFIKRAIAAQQPTKEAA